MDVKAKREQVKENDISDDWHLLQKARQEKTLHRKCYIERIYVRAH